MKRKNIKKIAIIIGIVVIPLLYSLFYLKAFFDPYNSLSEVPVAVVNEDKGSNINGEKQNLGTKMANKLEKNDTLNFIITDNDDAIDGVKNDSYYASITIPEDFSKKIATLNDNDKQVAQIIYSSNEKKNYLAAQILKTVIKEIEISLQKEITGNVIDNLTNNIEQTPDSLRKINSAVIKLSTGTTTLLNGSNELYSGTNTLSKNYEVFNYNINKINEKVPELQSGSNKIITGINKAKEGTQILTDKTENLADLSSSIELFSTKYSTFNSSIGSYTLGVENLIKNNEQLGLLIKSYVENHPEAMTDENMQTIIQTLNNEKNNQMINTLKESSSLIRKSSNDFYVGINDLQSGTENLPLIHDNLINLNNGLENLQLGSQAFNNGINDLAASAPQLVAASNQINTGIYKINNGSYSLYSGINSLDNGTKELNKEIDNGINEVGKQTSKLNNLEKYATTSFEIKNDTVDPVPNYGTSFAPYFMSLSLWVGAIMIFFGIYYDPENRFELLSKDSKHPFIRTLAYLGIGIIQALIIALILHSALGIEVHHLAKYYLACCLVSVVFVSIVQFLMIFFKDIGKFLSLLFLILQLTSCGGTFPMETVPKLFNILYPFMPMTYSVNLFKETISSVDESHLLLNLMVLISILIITTILTMICSARSYQKRLKNEK